MLVELGDAVTRETITRLQKQASSFATKTLDEVSQIAGQIDWSPFDAEGTPGPDAVRALVERIDMIEQKLNSLCPVGVYQQTGAKFECTADRIPMYETRLSTLSLWEHVQFLHWLRGLYRRRRDELAHAISQQLMEAESLGTLDGQPFPIGPLTMPLKALHDELVASLTTGGLTSRGAVPVPGYPQPVNMYLYMTQYTNAWQRLEALARLIEKAQPESFWARFQAARMKWAETLALYQSAARDWNALEQFVGKATSPAWSNARPVRSSLSALRGLVEGGLQQAVNAEVANHGPEKMIEALKAEVDAAAKFHSLPDQIRELRQAVEKELTDIIDQTRLQALGRVLIAKRRSQLPMPKQAATYAESQAAFEAFNVKVIETGRSYFEEAGQRTTWDRWVEIYVALRDGKYAVSPDDETALRELEDMKLIERTVKLK
jgi:hypothetical protein